MEYLDVQWRNAPDLEPVRLVSELDKHRQEIRKLEFFPNGTVGFATVDVSSRGTELSVTPVPTLEEINRDSQFVGSVMTAREFEELWNKYARHDA